MRVHSEVDSSSAAKRQSWVARLAILKNEKDDSYFRMAYFHHLFKHTSLEISEAEAAIKALPIELD
jgi:hypothetical protein